MAKDHRQTKNRSKPRNQRHAWIAFAAALPLALTGCKVGPDFKPPHEHEPTPGEYDALGPDVRSRVAGASSAVPETGDLARWWTLFGDDHLTSLVERATAQNLDLATAESRIRQARAARDIAASGLYPSVNAAAGGTRSRASGGSSGFSRTGNLFRAGFDAAWELDVFGGTRRGVEASDADIRSAIENERDVRTTIAAEVATAYMDLRTAQQRLAITQENLSSQRQTLDITRLRFEGGYITGLDVANQETQVSNTASRIPTLEASIRGSAYSIAVLLGQEPESLIEELRSLGPIPPPPLAVPVGLPSDLLRRRPDIRRAEENMHGATARVGVAVADLYPKFSLTGSLGIQSADFSGLGSIANRYWSIGPQMNWPIFAGGQIRANIRVQEALAEQAGIAYRQTVLTALQDVETSLTNFSKEQDRRALLQDAVAASSRAVDIAMEQYTVGRTDFLNVLTSQASLFSAQDALAQSTSAVSTDLVALYKALGGGWELPGHPGVDMIERPEDRQQDR